MEKKRQQMRKIIGLVAALAFVAACSGYQESYQENSDESKKEGEQKEDEKVIGGGCEYKGFIGKCTVTAIPEEGSPAFSYEGQSAKGTIKVDGCGMAFNRVTPYSGNLPPRSAIAKTLNIAVRNSYDCDLACATAGTCTPHSFSFKDLGNDDYEVSGFGADGCDYHDLCIN